MNQSDSLIDERLTVCERAARAGGAALLDWASRFSVREKGPADLVTEADLASQEVVRRILLTAFPDDGFVAEESPEPHAPDAPYRWVVDPLDGTTNYVHQMPEYAASVALLHRGEVVVGTVFNPATDECFTAARGRGASLNGRTIATSRVRQVSDALVASSFPPRVDREAPEVRQFLNVLEACQSVRRLGSAALNLCYVGCGRLDAYWSTCTRAWDIAAGLLIVREAGGADGSLDGGDVNLDRPRFVAASTRELLEELMPLINRGERR